MKKSTKKLFQTATLISALSILERCFGFLYRIVLSQKLGEELLGVYQIAGSVAAVFLTVGVGGLPVTLSRFIARFQAEKTPYKENAALSSALLLSLLLTLFPTCLFLIFGEKLAVFLPDERSLSALKILLIGHSFGAVFEVFRGRMWGHKSFFTPTLLELLEEAVRVLLGIIFLYAKGAMPLIERVAWAMTLSYVFSCTLSLIFYLFEKSGTSKFASPMPLLKPVFASTLPITASKVGSSLLSSVVAVLLPVLLMRAGMSNSDAMKAFGVLTGMVVPVLFIPATLIGSLALILSPQITEAYYKNDRRRLNEYVVRGLTAVTLLAGVLIPTLYVAAPEIGRVLFSSELAGKMIQKGSPILLPMSLAMLSTTVLNAIGKEKISFRFYLFGALTMLSATLLLPNLFGASAYLIGLGGNFLVTSLCNLVYLKKEKILKEQFFSKLLLVGASFLPASLFAQLLQALFTKFLPSFFALIFTLFTALILSILVLLLLIRPKKRREV